MMKSTKFILFLFCLGIFSACQPTLELPNNLEDETPTFQVSADIEGRSTPVSFIVGGSRTRIDLLTNRTDFMVQCTETQLGSLSFIFPARLNSFPLSPDYTLLQSEDNSVAYNVNYSSANTYYTLFVNDTIYKLNNYNGSFIYPSAPKKIAFVSQQDTNIRQTFYNPAFNPPSANLSISNGAGVAVSSSGAGKFQWNTGSTTPLSPLDSSATSKYYCVTVSGSNPATHSEACGLVTKFNDFAFMMSAQTHIISLIPDFGNLANNNWMALKFTDTDGVTYRSELGKQPAESFFAIDRAELYEAPDFTLSGGGFSGGRSIMRLDVRFDCVLYTPYGKQLHLKNGKGTIAVMIGF
jgi:hypothetical protein